jgi:hypothetical protein
LRYTVDVKKIVIDDKVENKSVWDVYGDANMQYTLTLFFHQFGPTEIQRRDHAPQNPLHFPKVNQILLPKSFFQNYN